MDSVKRLLLVGGSGRIATAIRPLLAGADRAVRLLDTVQPRPPVGDREEFIEASVTDLPAMEAACAGVDLVVHLGGHAKERPWQEIVDTNITGTYNVVEAARRQGVLRVLLASSIHAVGYACVADAGRSEVLLPRPDTLYGVGKVAAEALGSLYADRFGLWVVSARIANFNPQPDSLRGLALWFAPADMVRLIDACLRLDAPGHHIVWGVSRNTRGWANLDAGRAIGFQPEEDSELFAGGVPGAEDADPAKADTPLGGGFISTDRELGTRW